MILICVCVFTGVCVGPDSATGVAKDRGGEALSDADQTGSINLHYQIVNLDPAHTNI